jgi:hypothetical protein
MTNNEPPDWSAPPPRDMRHPLYPTAPPPKPRELRYPQPIMPPPYGGPPPTEPPTWQIPRQPQHAAPPEPPKKSKKWVPWVIAGVVLLIVGGLLLWFLVFKEDAPRPPAADDAPATTTQSLSAAEQDAQFYRWVLRHPWAQNGNTQADWTDLGGAMCGAFDRGAGYDDVATILIDELDDFTTADAREFVTRAVEIYCPEHLDQVN